VSHLIFCYGYKPWCAACYSNKKDKKSADVLNLIIFTFCWSAAFAPRRGSSNACGEHGSYSGYACTGVEVATFEYDIFFVKYFSGLFRPKI
jgi:hypothetical protein